MTVEYTQSRTKALVDRYTAAVKAGANYDARTALVKELAAELTVEAEVEVTEGSVRSKLVSEKVYVAKEKAKGEADSNDKEAYIKALRAVTGLELKSVDKATKVDIKALFQKFVDTSNQFHADNGIDEVEILKNQA